MPTPNPIKSRLEKWTARQEGQHKKIFSYYVAQDSDKPTLKEGQGHEYWERVPFREVD